MKTLTVELSTPKGRVFAAKASSIDLRTEQGSVHLNSREGSYLNLIHATEITLRTRDGVVVFGLKNAVAGLNGTALSVLAEEIRRIDPEAGSENLEP